MKSNYIKELNFLIAILLIWTLVPLITGVFGVADDYLFFKEYRLMNYWEEGFISAQLQGRFYQCFVKPIFFNLVPYMFEDLTTTSAINMVLFGVDFILLAFFVSRILKDSYVKYFVLIFLLIALTIQGHYNPLVSYPIYFSFSILLIIISWHLLLNYNEKQHVSSLILSACCFGIAVLFVEMHLLYILIIFAINGRTNMTFHNIRKNANLPFVIISFFYVIVYASWKMLFSSNLYEGNKIDSFELNSFISTLVNFSQGGMPLNFFFTSRELFHNNSYLLNGHIQNVFNVLIHAKIEWIIKGLFIGTATYLVLALVKHVDRKKLRVMLVLSFCFIFLPNILISLTPKYQSWRWENYYVYTFYSYLAVIVFLSTIFILVLSYINKPIWKSVYMGLLTFLFFIVSIVTDYINVHAITSIRKSQDNIEMIKGTFRSECVKNIPNHSVIIIPSIFNQYSDILYFKWDTLSLSEFVNISSGKQFSFKQSYAESDSGAYYMKYGYTQSSNEAFITISKLKKSTKDSLLTDKITLLIHSSNKYINLNIDHNGSDSLRLNGEAVTSGKNIRIRIRQPNKDKNLYPIELAATDLDINSLFISSFEMNDISVEIK